ncbi:MAG: CBS domain-containing protein [Myxococcota bacterium]
MLCSEIMRRDVICCQPDESCQAAAAKMRDRDIGFLPVCDRSSGRLIGTLTDRDLAIRLVALGKDCDTAVEVVMSRDRITCRGSDDVRVAEKAMSDNQKARIVVIDDRGVPVGVISFADLARRTEPVATAETLKQVKAPQPPPRAVV